MQDIVSDFISRVNNSLTAGHSKVEVIKSKFILSLVTKLTKLNFFDSFEVKDRTIEVQINTSKLKKLHRVSKPGKRVYAGKEDVITINNGFGNNIFTTSKGIYSDAELRKLSEKLGGEVVLQAIRPYLTRKNN